MTAALHQKAGRPERAVSLYLEVAEHDLGNYMAHVQLARIAEASGNYELAIKERRRAVDANPDDAFLLTELGVTLGKSGNMAEAVDILEKAADQNPRDVRPLFWLGVGYSSLGRNADARTAYTQFLERVPSRYDKQIAAAKDRLAKLPQ
jgi:Flp pilus assembly protein TadD